MPRGLQGWRFAIGLALLAAASEAQTPASFSKDIQPILEASCWKCHGAGVQLSKLDLRTRESALAGGTHGPAITPGNPDGSRLYRMVAGLDKPAMPIDGKLPQEQIDKIRQWIQQGAAWDAVAPSTSKAGASDLEGGTISPEARKYWAFQLPVRRAPPVTGNERMNRHPI